jgi:hypothetical protein
LTNDASIKTTYEVEIDVLTTDGTNDVVDTITGITIHTVCGEESTTLTAPVLDFLTKAPNTLPVLSITGDFETSNPTCPVESFAILTGAENFILTSND